MPVAKPQEFRRPALDLLARVEPVAAVAKNLGISESCLRRWRSQEDVKPGPGRLRGRRPLLADMDADENLSDFDLE